MIFRKLKSVFSPIHYETSFLLDEVLLEVVTSLVLDEFKALVAGEHFPATSLHGGYGRGQIVVASEKADRLITHVDKKATVLAKLLERSGITGAQAIFGIDGVRIDDHVTGLIVANTKRRRVIPTISLEDIIHHQLPAHPELPAPVLAVLALDFRAQAERIHQEIDVIVLFLVNLVSE